jgi:hypothetical protein
MITDAHSHMMNSQYFNRMASIGGKGTREKVNRGLADIDSL